MITLYQFHPAFGLPNASPFCMKVETFLRMAEIDHELRYTDYLSSAPKGKLPYIKEEKGKLGDSGIIIEYLTRECNVGLDEKLSAKEKAIAHAFRGLCEERLYFAVFYTRWAVPENWKVVKKAFFSRVPFFLRPFVPEMARKSVLRDLRGQGMGRHSPKEVEAMAIQDIKAISEFLGEKPYFMGGEPTSIDAVIYPFMANIIVPEIPSKVREQALLLGNLNTYVERMTERYFPDYLQSSGLRRQVA